MRWSWLSLLAVLACSPTDESAGTGPTVRIIGSDTMMESLVPRLTAAYGTAHDTRFSIGGGGSSDGFRALLERKADLAASARPPTPAETDQAKAYGFTFERHLVGLSVVTISVHPQNPLQSLTWEQVRDIFCTATLRDWSELGLEPQPIRVLVRNERSGSREALEDFFCGVDGISRRHTALSAPEIEAQIAKDTSVITFAPLSDKKGKVLGLRPRPDARPIAPTQANAIRGKYPLTHDLALYTAGPPSPQIQSFLRWIASPAGQQQVDEAWVVPLYLRTALLDGARPLRETLTFAEASTEPDERSKVRLGVVLDELRARAGEINHIIIEGYADPNEPEPMTLSYGRATAVRDHLAANLPALFFEIIPRGAEPGLAPTDTPLGLARHRSVRIYFGEEERGGSLAARPEGAVDEP